MAKSKNSAEPKKVASDFEKIIQDGRERKKNEALAQRIFSKDRRQSAPVKGTKFGGGGSLASRVGVKKRASIGPVKPAAANPAPAGNIHGDWTHDLHSTVNGGAGGKKNTRADRRAEARAAKMADALERSSDLIITGRSGRQNNQPPMQPAKTQGGGGKGMSIRGLAGPYAVMAQNFAPGTTAADIESAMTPVGGEMVSCNIVKTSPIIIVEMAFASKDGGEAVINTFNNQTADGRVIKVYPKPGGYKEPSKAGTGNHPANAPSGPRAQRSGDGNFVDGSNGFAEVMQTDNNMGNDQSSSGRLYSDRMVGGGGGRRGRGFNRGGR